MGTLLKFLLISMFALGSSTVVAQEVIDKLVNGPREGAGILMGSPAEFEMDWKWTLDKQFLELNFQNKRTTEKGAEMIFKAKALYRFHKDGTIKGMWFDSRGLSFPLTGSVEGSKFIVEWGSPEIEQGKTIYGYIGEGKISVTDHILKEGKYLKFGEAIYQQ